MRTYTLDACQKVFL